MSEEDRAKPLSFDEIEALEKKKPLKPQHTYAVPIAVGSTGISLGKGPRTVIEGDDDDLNKDYEGARLKR